MQISASSLLPLVGEAGLVPDGFASLLLACGAGLLIFLTVVRMRRRYADTTSEPQSARERLAGIRKRAAARDEVGTAMAEVEELTRRCAAHLDNKAERLEYLLELAEARIAELEARLGKQAADDPAPCPDDAASSSEPAAFAFPGAARGESQTPARSSGDRVEAGAADERRPQPVASERIMDPLMRQIYELADEGATPVEIARKLDEQVGKVELILALRAG